MADVRVLLVETRASISCPNCSSTQTNTVRLYWNETQDRLDVDKVCVCQVDGDDATIYEENNQVAIPEV